mmetsp:Transcript_16104/g.46589  ORF Transcript_16104/g.46589 Transcript_16104/m.46589 type:complete len:245 (-) Transcript_16104:125-859(-)
MEFVATVLAGGIGAAAISAGALAAQRRKRRVGDGRWPHALPGVLSEQRISDYHMVMVLVVHIRRAELPPELAEKRVKICVKYGKPGESVKCETSALPRPRRTPPAAFRTRNPRTDCVDTALPVGEACVFLARRQMEFVIRLRLVEADGKRKPLAKAELYCRPLWRQDHRQGLALAGDRGRPLCFLDVSMEMLAVSRGDLRAGLAAIGAELQPDAALIYRAPIVQGEVVDELGHRIDDDRPRGLR